MAGLATIIPARFAPITGRDVYVEQRQYKVRLLPFVVICGGLLLATKGAALYMTMTGQLPLPGQIAKSDTARTEAVKTDRLAQALNAIATAGGGEPAPTAPAASAAPAAAPAKPAAAKADDSTTSQSEIELLDSLQARRQKLDQREKELEMREGLLQASEKRIDSKIGDLKHIEDSIKQLIAQKDQQDEERMANLVKVYETMKPADAARIFNKLEMDILVQVAQRMKQSKIAAVLAAMDANNAKSLTVELAAKKPLPPA